MTANMAPGAMGGMDAPMMLKVCGPDAMGGMDAPRMEAVPADAMAKV